MLVVALKGQSRINPILLTLSVVTHIGVSEPRQFTGGVFRRMSGRTSAVNDDLRTPIGRELRSKRRDIFGRHVYGPG